MNKTISCLEQEYYRKITFAFPTILEKIIHMLSVSFKPLSKLSNIDLKLREVYKDFDLKYGTGQR